MFLESRRGFVGVGGGGFEDLLPGIGVDIPAFAERDIAVVSCARGSGAVGHVAAWEAGGSCFVDAGFEGWEPAESACWTPYRSCGEGDGI